jgi:hypothetical protein
LASNEASCIGFKALICKLERASGMENNDDCIP